ncbi:hypothetical protein Nepgr_030833 [Nepenthes gracilis]|uniref:HRDC domain-containing protein n=1 Tax=Nepenthes gracilis TaxID=150966 RepID=A0AAD3TG56_NEPGR|nr:hypothetical protein Nepgr_030833 [Nepenthes gracilis]
MEIDDPCQSDSETLKRKSESLQALSTGSVSPSICKLSGSSRGIPSDKDFHFYYNFDGFRAPIDEISANSKSMLQKIGSANHFWGAEMAFPEDIDDGYDWLVNVNDELFERFDSSVDEFSRIRKSEEEAAKGMIVDNGFQLVRGKKKKAMSMGGMKGKDESMASSAVRMADRDKRVDGTKPKVPFHIPTIRRPQEEFNILVNNSNHPFEHVWLQRSDDDSSFIHPLENQSVLDFVDQNIGDIEPMKSLPTESTPFKLVEEVMDLKLLAAKLRNVNEFAVDLEHNQYRSFQGLTCLMQISTRTEDFVIDTLKLRIQIGPYLREIFKDPAKKKIMHGADRDIMWLQRDFGIYVCNLFDTGQASRVLKLERNSLEYLLRHFCGVTANKEYQNADWRLRPLPAEMLRYAREDTHYLLYIYDLMRVRLLSMSAESEETDTPLVEVYKRSYELCMQLYEKELLTDTSYLYIYGLQGANFTAQQLSIAAGLHEWRDIVARAEDESTGYILPNKILLEIAKQMPVTTSKLRRLVGSKHLYVDRNLGSIVNIVRHSIQNAAAFEAVAKQLKEGHVEVASELNAARADRSETLQLSEAYLRISTVNDDSKGGNAFDCSKHGNAPASGHLKEDAHRLGRYEAKAGNNDHGDSSYDIVCNEHTWKDTNGNIPEFPKENLAYTGQINDMNTTHLHPEKVAAATVQVLKKPRGAFVALLGNSALKKRTENSKDKVDMKLEQIKSCVNLPFHSFSGEEDQHSKQVTEEEFSGALGSPCMEECPSSVLASTSKLEEIITLDVDEGESNSDEKTHTEKNEEMSLSDLSSSFQKCFRPTDQQQEKPNEPGHVLFSPFDYEAARKQVKFGVDVDVERVNDGGKDSGGGGGSSSRDRHGCSVKIGVTADRIGEDEGRLAPGRRRQVFPASGNRSATFL